MAEVMAAVEVVVVVVVRVENAVRGMLGAELRGRFSVKTARSMSTMLWDCIAWPVWEEGGAGGGGMNILSNQWHLGLCHSGGLGDVGRLGWITCTSVWQGY